MLPSRLGLRKRLRLKHKDLRPKKMLELLKKLKKPDSELKKKPVESRPRLRELLQRL